MDASLRWHDNNWIAALTLFARNDELRNYEVLFTIAKDCPRQ